MTLNGFIFLVVVGLFGYNWAATEWQRYQQRKVQRDRERRANRR